MHNSIRRVGCCHLWEKERLGRRRHEYSPHRLGQPQNALHSFLSQVSTPTQTIHPFNMSSEKKKKRGRPAKSPSCAPDEPIPLTLQDLARSHVQVQKELKQIRNLLLAQPSTSTAGAPSADLRNMSDHSSSTEPADNLASDNDYPSAAQTATTRGSASTLTRKSNVVRKGKKRKNKDTVTSSDESSSTDEDSSLSTAEASLATRRKRARRAVTQLLDAAAPDKPSRRGKKNFIPGNFIKRGDKFQKVGHGEASLPEYLLALKAMSKAPECPVGWAAHLARHEEQLLTMATMWEWSKCRHWSEAVFVMIHDGRLPEGWTDMAALKDIQRDVIAVGKRGLFMRDGFAPKAELNKKQSYTTPAVSTRTEPIQRQQTGETGRVTYEKEKDGKPCYPWNWGRECGFQASHGAEPDLKPHICAYCAYRTHKVLAHREMECINKQRAAVRAPASSVFQKDFQ